MYKMVPIARVGKKLYVAMADPLNVLAMDELRRDRPNMEIIPLITTEKAVGDFLNASSSQVKEGIDEILRDVDLSDIEIAKDKQEEINLDKLVESSEEAPVIKLVNLMLVQAIKDRASDIHIEPFEKQLRLRYRIDGVLYDSTAPPKSIQSALTSRIKIMSTLDIAERRLPQDGRFRIKIAGRDVDLRVSVLPTIHGEKIVLRVLDKGTLTTGTNEPVNELRNCVIIMTSNVGSREVSLKTDGGLGFFIKGDDVLDRAKLSDGFTAAAKRKFMPEFLNRIDEIVMFNSLTMKDLEEIIELELKHIQWQVIQSARAKVYIKTSPAAKAAIIAEGYDKKQNARNLKRAVERRVGKAVQRAMTTWQVKDLDSVVVDYAAGEFTYHVEATV